MSDAPHIDKAVFTDLDTLSHFWCFKRKAIAATVSRALSNYEKQVGTTVAELKLNHQQQLTYLETEQQAQLQHLNAQHQHDMAQQKQVLTTQINALEAQRIEQNLRNERLVEKVAVLDETITNTQALLSQNQASLHVLEELKQQLDVSHQQLQQDYSQLHHDNLTLSERFALLQSILSAQPSQNAGLEAFRQLLHSDYAAFAAEESSLADEAGALLILQNVLADLEQLNTFPAASGKTVVGVAGGFSSGKSEFINSFIQDKSLKLATGINPVTVIPSFVVYAPDSRICGYAKNGGNVPLSSKLYKALSHDYLAAFGFDLRTVMPTISLQAPMDEALFEHICLVDTPGYNPGAVNRTEAADRSTTLELLTQCSAMIWVIGLDPAGTIAQSDIEFIRQSAFTADDVYVVLNKADVKPQEDIEAIIETVADELLFAGIGYAGMTAYSSTRLTSYATKGCTLDAFLKNHNTRFNTTCAYEEKIDRVFSAYNKALQSDIDNIQLLRVRLKDLQFRTLADSGAKALKELQPVIEFFNPQLADEARLQKLIERSQQLSAAFRTALREAITLTQPGEIAQRSTAFNASLNVLS